MTETSIIPVFFATDENYVPYQGVSLQSLIAHTAHNKQYEIYILHDSLSEHARQQLREFKQKNVNISFLKVSDHLQQYQSRLKNNLAFWNQPTYYRLALPLLTANYDKILYCDCDTVFLDDVARLYEQDIEDNYLLAVQDADHPYYIPERIEQMKTELKLADTSRYFNAGILVMNVALMRQNNLFDRFIELRETIKYLPYHDQDILNSACRDKIKYLSRRYNYQWHLDFFYNDPEAAKAYRQDIEPAIVHFTSHIKPWNEPKREFADKFWYYARQTPFYEEILFRSIAKQKLGIDYTEIAAATNRKDCLSLLRRYKFIAFFGLGSTRKKYKQKVKTLKQLLRNTAALCRL